MSDNTIIAIATSVLLLAGAGIVLLLDLLTSMSSHDLWTYYAMFAVFLVVLVGTNIVVNWWADRHHIQWPLTFLTAHTKNHAPSTMGQNTPPRHVKQMPLRDIQRNHNDGPSPSHLDETS